MNINDIKAINNSTTSEYTSPHNNAGTNSPKLNTDGMTQVEKQLIQTIEKANHLQSGTTECQFSVHEATKQIMIKVIDTKTKEVIKEIPSEKILDMVADMCELAGVFVDEKR